MPRTLTELSPPAPKCPYCETREATYQSRHGMLCLECFLIVENLAVLWHTNLAPATRAILQKTLSESWIRQFGLRDLPLAPDFREESTPASAQAASTMGV